MPRLNGKERKDKIRRERALAWRDLSNERKEHRRTRYQLASAKLKIQELEARIERMAQIGEGLIAEAKQVVRITPEQVFEKLIGEPIH